MNTRTTMTESYEKPPTEELRQRLSPLQFKVTQEDATEPPFRNAYWDNKKDGLYVDVASSEPLFSSRDKFRSGTGWPSFTKPIEANRVVEVKDRAHGMLRTEVRSKSGDSHLGHLFPDGPAPGGLRYCINSASLRFIPVERLQAEGYGRFLANFGPETTNSAPTSQPEVNSCTEPETGKAPGCEATVEVAVLAGGCFWGMEEIIRKIPGVLETRVGYAGGDPSAANYPMVKTGRTGHAEALEVVFDPKTVSYNDLLEKWFFRMHDPTTKNRQGNDIGSQYRSAIFVTSEAQRKTAQAVIARVDAGGTWNGRVVTEVTTAGQFTAAETHHQDYLQKHPGGYTCHYMRD